MTRNLYIVPNPDGSDPADFVNIKIERAPNAAGVPGTWAQITSMLIDLSEENTEYLDAGGALDSWYRHRFTTLGDVLPSDYSPPMQLGDYIVRQWCIADVPTATDITTTDWDRWRDQTLQDMALFNLGRDADIQSIIPSSYTDEWHDIDAGIRQVTRVDLYVGDTYITDYPMWSQRGRRLRLVQPSPSYTYKVYGSAEIRGFNDLDDELFTLLYWGMRIKYLERRIADRIDFRKYLASSKGEDISTSQLLALKNDAVKEWTSRAGMAQQQHSIPAFEP